MTDAFSSGLVQCARGLCISAICAILPGFAYSQSYGLQSRPSVGAYLNGALPAAITAGSGTFRTVQAFPDIVFDTPTFLVPEPGTNRLFIGSDRGYIWAVDDTPGSTGRLLILDLSAHTQAFNGTGLMGLAFHPEYRQTGSPNRGYVYIFYQYTVAVVGSREHPPENNMAPCYLRLSRFNVPDGSYTIDPNSEVVMINQYDRDLWHPGGGMFFGADGFLYLAIGDEGGNADEYDGAQRVDVGLFGGVLRIDVDKNASRSHPIRRQPRTTGTPPGGWPATYSAEYYIPNDNPFLDSGGGILEEFYAIGLRSPHRMTLDSSTGRILVGDVGNAKEEEVDLIQKAGNYQWPWMEGNTGGVRAQPSSIRGQNIAAAYAYPHDQGNNCVIGGYIYRGAQFAAQIGGKFIFGDNISNRIWAADINGGQLANVTEIAALPAGTEYYGGLSSFGLSHSGELYLCTTGPYAKIYRLELSSSSGTSMPGRLSQTGAFSNVVALTPATGLVPYTVNVPFWSDNAVKTRWMAVPNGTQIGFSSSGEWSFPNGTVFVKHFDLPVDDRNPGVMRRVETRVLVRDANGGVYGGTYRWRSDYSDADLVTTSISEDFVVTTSGGGTRTQRWSYPGFQDCMLCHTPNAGYVLGVKTRQINGLMTYASGVSDNQLRTLNHIGLLSPAISEASISSLARLVPLTDSSASVEVRMRSYLDANCAQCHRPNGVGTYFDARFDTPLDAQGIINGRVANDLGIANARIIVPGDLSRSLIYVRMTAGSNRMPPFGANSNDQQAIGLLSGYIAALAGGGAPPPPPPGGVPGHLVNVAGRANAASGDQTLITGFVIAGSGSKRLLLRGVGPTLVSMGVPNAIGDPSMDVVPMGASTVIATNDNWGSAANAADAASTANSLGAFPLPAGSRDSALLTTVLPGVYTAQVKGIGGSSGVALAEIYDASTDTASALAAPIVNLSIRTQVGTGSGILIAGFVIAGDSSARLLIRGVGPGLTQYGVGGVLADPMLQVFNSSQVLIAENNNWGDSDAGNISAVGTTVGAFAFASGSRDAAVVVTLPPGAYTAQLSGVNGGTGVGLIELYVVP